MEENPRMKLQPATRAGIALIAVMLITFLVFSGAMRFDFVNFDDSIYVGKNPLVQTLSWANVRWLFSNVYYHQYIPVTMMSHALDYAVWKSDPRGHHLTNVVLHSFNAGWVFLLALLAIGLARRRSTGEIDATTFGGLVGNMPLFGAAAAALLFSLHPLKAESVAWVSDRKDLLCTFFLVPSFIAYIRYASLRGTARARGWLVLSVSMFVLALLSKLIAAVVPAVFLLLDYLLLPKEWRRPLSRLIWEKMAMLVPAAIVALVSMIASPHAKVNVIVGKLTGVETWLFPFYSLFFYVEKTLLPVGLAPMYGSVGVGMMVFSFVAVVAIGALCVAAALRRSYAPLLVFGASVIILLPTIVGVSSGSQPFADRYFYLASIGVCILVGGGMQGLWERGTKSTVRLALPVAVALVLVIFGLLSFRQAGHWQNSETLWTYVLTIGTQSVEYMDGYTNLEQAYLQAGMYDAAETVFKRAVAIDSTAADAYFNMGYVCYYRGQTDSAMYLFRKTVRLDPAYAEAYFNIGVLNIAMKNEAAAVDSLKKAAQLGSRDAQQVLAKNGVKW